MDGFFMYENHAWPPLLASNSTVIHTTTKSDLISCARVKGSFRNKCPKC